MHGGHGTAAVQLDGATGEADQLKKTGPPGEGAGWKIFNLNVMGVWLMETYRSQFAAEINARGIDGLIEALAARNRANAGANAAAR